MDLFESLQPKPFRYEVKFPGSDKGTGLFLEVVSAADPRVKAAERDYLTGVQDLAAKSGERKSPDRDELARVKARAAVIGCEFTGEATWKGKTPAFSAALRDEIMENERVYEQVLIQVVNDRNFFTN